MHGKISKDRSISSAYDYEYANQHRQRCTGSSPRLIYSSLCVNVETVSSLHSNNKTYRVQVGHIVTEQINVLQYLINSVE